jgi:hypothetical protein
LKFNLLALPLAAAFSLNAISDCHVGMARKSEITVGLSTTQHDYLGKQDEIAAFVSLVHPGGYDNFLGSGFQALKFHSQEVIAQFEVDSFLLFSHKISVTIMEKDFQVPAAGAPLELLLILTGGSHDEMLFSPILDSGSDLLKDQTRTFKNNLGDVLTVKVRPSFTYVTGLSELSSTSDGLKRRIEYLSSKAKKSYQISEELSNLQAELKYVEHKRSECLSL